MIRRALSLLFVLASLGACATAQPRPSASSPTPSGEEPSSGDAAHGTKKTLAEHRRDFMDQCTTKNGTPDFCECSWDQMRQVFTEDELNAPNADEAKIAKFEERMRAACSSKIPEDRIKESFSRACLKPSPKLAAYCDCKWGEFRKRFSAAELTDDAALKGQRLDDARKGAAKVCGGKYVESVAHDGFLEGCVKSDDMKPFCECAWKVLRQSAQPAEVDLDIVDYEALKPKVASACGKLRSKA